MGSRFDLDKKKFPLLSCLTIRIEKNLLTGLLAVGLVRIKDFGTVRLFVFPDICLIMSFSSLPN